MHPKSKKPSTKITLFQKVLIIGAGLVTVCFLAIVFFLFSPTNYPAGSGDYPLGDELEYIGKQNYGCQIFCDSSPSSTLFYATNLSKEKLMNHFKKATYQENNFVGGSGDDYSYESLTFIRTPDTGFGLSYYNNQNVIKDIDIYRESSKKYIVSLDAESYQLAKDSL